MVAPTPIVKIVVISATGVAALLGYAVYLYRKPWV